MGIYLNGHDIARLVLGHVIKYAPNYYLETGKVNLDTLYRSIFNTLKDLKADFELVSGHYLNAHEATRTIRHLCENDSELQKLFISDFLIERGVCLKKHAVELVSVNRGVVRQRISGNVDTKSDLKGNNLALSSAELQSAVIVEICRQIGKLERDLDKISKLNFELTDSLNH